MRRSRLATDSRAGGTNRQAASCGTLCRSITYGNAFASIVPSEELFNMNDSAGAPALPIRFLHHVARVTRRLEESRAFYRDVLGFREMPRPELKFPGAWLFNYGLQIHLIVNDGEGLPVAGSPTAAIETRDNHLAFLVDDIEAAEARLQSHGVAYRVNLQAATGLKQIFFRDPDGYHVEVAMYPA